MKPVDHLPPAQTPLQEDTCLRVDKLVTAGELRLRLERYVLNISGDAFVYTTALVLWTLVYTLVAQVLLLLSGYGVGHDHIVTLLPDRVLLVDASGTLLVGLAALVRRKHVG